MYAGFLSNSLFKWVITASLFMSSCAVTADSNWSYHQENDRLTNRSFSYARAPLPRSDLYDNLQLEIACKENQLQVSIEAEVLIASQGSAFDFEYQIDKQPAIKVQMHTFSDSKRKGFTEQNAKQIADAILNGQSIFIRVNTMIRRVLSGEMPLNDAATPIKQVYADCGLSSQSTEATAYSLKQFNADFNTLSSEKQTAVLMQLKDIMHAIQP